MAVVRNDPSTRSIRLKRKLKKDHSGVAAFRRQSKAIQGRFGNTPLAHAKIHHLALLFFGNTSFAQKALEGVILPSSFSHPRMESQVFDTAPSHSKEKKKLRAVRRSEGAIVEDRGTGFPSARYQKDLRRVQSVLHRLVKSGEAARWLATGNDLLGGEKPRDLIRRGETHRVLEILSLVEEGIHV